MTTHICTLVSSATTKPIPGTVRTPLFFVKWKNTSARSVKTRGGRVIVEAAMVETCFVKIVSLPFIHGQNLHPTGSLSKSNAEFQLPLTFLCLAEIGSVVRFALTKILLFFN